MNDSVVPIKSWCPDIETSAYEQAENLAQLPVVFHHVALMPDAHFGYGMPIGGVCACKDAIIPNAVGVDIGCGMCFLQTNIPVKIMQETEDGQGRNLLKLFTGNVPRTVPLGMKRHKIPQAWPGFHRMEEEISIWPDVDEKHKHFNTARHSLGTLGGGNHFIELQRNSDDKLCIMLHSGSRNLGLQICKHFNDIAKEQCSIWFQHDAVKNDLAFLPVNSDVGQAYIKAMNFALDFAMENRRLMMERVKSLVFNLVSKYYGDFKFEIHEEVNAHHNYAALENHFGENVWVHRKGAIRAREGDIGIIPGSMGTPSYIVRGRQNPDSFHSCSHGSGRKMGRKQAKRELDVEQVAKSLEGVEHNLSKNSVEEAPGAYKDISQVMANQSDLVEILMELHPIACVKGD